MRSRGLKRTALWIFACSVMVTATLSLAQTGSAPSVIWDSDPDTLLVSYRDVWAELANQDPTPLIRIFGDGRVLVHYPVYTPKAGEYELRLGPQELESLLTSMAAKGLATVDLQAAQGLKSSEEQLLRSAARDAARSEELLGVPVRDRTPELFMVADDSTTVFELHLTGYRPAGNSLAASATVDRSLSWRGLGTDAERYPDIEPIQQLRAAELELRTLLERADLRRVP